jgi:hypothetical protein
MGSWRFVAGFLVLAGVAACGGSSAEASPLASTVPVTTAAATTTTVAPTTSTTVAPTTTVVPSTTVDPKAKVLADYAATQRALDRCFASLPVCHLGLVAAEGSPARQNLQKFVDRLLRNGLRVAVKPDITYFVVESVKLNDQQTATIQTCAYDADVIYDPRDPADPNDDAVVDDRRATVRTRWLVRLEGGVFKQAEADVLSEEVGESKCPARPAGS